MSDECKGHGPKDPLEDAIEDFNGLRSPEATAELISRDDDQLVVRMSGPFCASCGLYDWFDDLAWELKDRLGKDIEVKGAKEVGDESYIITYSIL